MIWRVHREVSLMDINLPEADSTSAEPSPAARKLPNPVTERGCNLRTRVSKERWQELVLQAQERMEQVKAVKKLYKKGERSLDDCLGEAAPGVNRSTFLNWKRKLARRRGHEWERLLDARVPPSPPPIPEGVRLGGEMLRRANPTINCETARSHLVAQFGEKGRICDTSLRQIWRQAGLRHPGDPSSFEKVQRFPGGALLALLGAAATESGVSQSLAEAALRAAHAAAAAQERPGQRDTTPGRDEHGRFTPIYNDACRDGVMEGQADARWHPDPVKRARRDLGALQLLNLTPETLGQRILAMGLTPLLTGLRGFDGVDNPRGRWLELAGGFPYRAATLDKTLAQLALLDTGEALWAKHGQIWVQKAHDWAQGGPSWLSLICYVDITSEPHWTEFFSLAGKVSRTGRVMPCLQRVALMAGPGVPLLVATEAGTLSLKKTLFQMLRAADALGQPLGGTRLTVVDAEAATTPILSVLVGLPGAFITVLKGALRESAQVTGRSAWMPYRKRDKIREVKVVLTGGMTLRGVEILRESSRHPHTTLLLTNASRKFLSTEQAADAYFSRWPHQEGGFRTWRNGAGLERTHGFSGEYVKHIALEDKLSTANARVEAACRKLEAAKEMAARAQDAKTGLTGTDYSKSARESAAQAATAGKKAEDTLNAAKSALKKVEAMPSVIRKRDTTRENIATVLKLSMLMLVEWVLREYFGGLQMELETLLETFLYLPTEVRTTRYRLRYRIETTGLPSKRADQLQKACEAVNERKIRRDGRLLRFEVVNSLVQDHAPPRN